MYPRTRGGKGSPTKSDQPGVNIAVVNKFRCPPLRRSRRGHRAFGYEHSALLALLMAVLAPACKKDADGTPPVVEILSIGAGSPITVPQDVMVTVRVSDDRSVEGLTVQLLNAVGQAIAPVVSHAIGSASATVEVAVAVHDERIPTGTFTLLARATDGANDGRAFADVAVTAAPLRFRGLYALGSGGASTPVYRLDSLMTLSTLFVLPHDAANGALDTYESLLFVGGRVNGPVSAVDLNTGTTRWQIPNENTGSLPWFHSLAFDRDRRWLWVTSEDGRIRAFTTAGIQQVGAQATEGTRPQAIGIVDDRIVNAQTDITLGTRSLAVYWATSGALFNTHLVDHEVIGLHALDGQIMDLGNAADGATVHLEAPDGTGAWEPVVLAGAAFLDACPTTAGEFLLATSEGIHRYGGGTSAPLISALVADHVAYDAANDVCFASTGPTIHLLNAASGVELGTVVLPEAPLALLVRLNRDP